MPRDSFRTVADRLAILQEWRASGQSAKEFAETVGVRIWALYAWRRKFMPEFSWPRRTRAVPHDDQPKFAELVVAPAPHASCLTTIDILLDDVVIRVPSGAASTDVTTAIHAVRSAGRSPC